MCFTLVARALGDCHGLGAAVPPRSTAQGGREQSRARAERCAGTPPARELLPAAPKEEPHPAGSASRRGSCIPGAGT